MRSLIRAVSLTDPAHAAAFGPSTFVKEKALAKPAGSQRNLSGGRSTQQAAETEVRSVGTRCRHKGTQEGT